MEKNKKLNMLVLEYQMSKSDNLFNEIYSSVKSEFIAKSCWDKLIDSIAYSLNTGRHEVIELFEDTLIRCLERYKPTDNFINMYSTSIRRARINLFKKRRRVLNYELYEIEYESDESKPSILESIASEELTDETVWRKQKRDDQLALIDSLIGGSDELTTAIVKTFLEKPNLTRRGIGEFLGVHPSVVYRKLEKLAGKFDSKKYGDIRNYLDAI